MTVYVLYNNIWHLFGAFQTSQCGVEISGSCSEERGEMAESQAYSYAELRVFQICNGTFHFVSPGIISDLYISQKATNLPSKILH